MICRIYGFIFFHCLYSFIIFYIPVASKDLQQVNLGLAKAMLDGKLNENPLCQGLLVQCLRTLDKKSRGVSTGAGRHKNCNDAETKLVEDAALAMAILGHNTSLCKALGQKVRPPKYHWDDLPKHSLPNPCLALMTSRSEQLEENVQLASQWFALSPGQATRRCILAIDHTYLQARFVQGTVGGVPGLLGGAWSPTAEDLAFRPFESMDGSALKAPKANLMLECLIWDPCADRRQSLSLASMPMKLGKQNKGSRSLTKEGNMVSRLMFFARCFQTTHVYDSNILQ